MQLIGQPVSHSSFGKGVITDQSDKIVTVRFSQGDKRFIYPDAFTQFLTLSNEETKDAFDARRRQKQKAKQAREKVEAARRAHRRELQTMKLSANSQMVFQLPPAEAGPVLQEGRIFAGHYLSGDSKGLPRIPTRVKPNSAGLLTAIPEGGTEADRCIYGAFMVHDDFWGEDCRDGQIRLHPDYRIELPEDRTLAYWDFVPHGEKLPRWGSVPFKYFSSDDMQKILHDMCGRFSDPAQQKAAEQFYDYFCRINRLSPVLPVRQNGETQPA